MYVCMYVWWFVDSMTLCPPYRQRLLCFTGMLRRGKKAWGAGGGGGGREIAPWPFRYCSGAVASASYQNTSGGLWQDLKASKWLKSPWISMAEWLARLDAGCQEGHCFGFYSDVRWLRGRTQHHLGMTYRASHLSGYYLRIQKTILTSKKTG